MVETNATKREERRRRRRRGRDEGLARRRYCYC